MPSHRPDETYHRLLFWTYGSGLAERLSGHLLYAEGYRSIDPSHPLGGPDQGADAMCVKDGNKWVMASYFPWGQDPFPDIMAKFKSDVDAARHRQPFGIAFVTNQKITTGQREKLRKAAEPIAVDVLHLERNVHLLDSPPMSQIREQYIYIPATGYLPMDVKVSVKGVAHAFTDEADIQDRYVSLREDRIRERSEAGHERVRAERAERERAERERRAQEEAERARAAKERPWDIAAQLPGLSGIFGSNFLLPTVEPIDIDMWPGQHRREKPKPPEPLTEEQIQDRVAAYRRGLETRWPACRDYLAGTAWPALRVHVENRAESFLNDVQIILTFRGARGVDFEGMENFEFQKVENPDWQPRNDMGMSGVPMPPPLRLARRDDYPIDWEHNDDGDLEVTINLAQLRPHPAWRSESFGEDIVLVVDPDSDADQITMTYTVTAQGYGKEYVGEPLTVDVERVAMLEVLRNAMRIAEEAS